MESLVDIAAKSTVFGNIREKGCPILVFVTINPFRYDIDPNLDKSRDTREHGRILYDLRNALRDMARRNQRETTFVGLKLRQSEDQSVGLRAIYCESAEEFRLLLKRNSDHTSPSKEHGESMFSRRKSHRVLS